MKYQTPGAFRSALEANLNAARQDGVGISRLRKRVVFERLIARLSLAAPGAWVLKGGFALELRLDARARTTKDMDIDWTISEDEATDLLLDAAALELDDYFEFSIERSRVAEEETPRGGQRWTVVATLAGREFERVAIDVGFVNRLILRPETIVSEHLLKFADLPPVRVDAVAIEQHVAEKLHAYTRTYAGGVSSSRVKDLVDLVVIAHTMTMSAERLALVIVDIFNQRATHTVPEVMPPPSLDWERGWRGLVTNVPAEDDVHSGHVFAAACLDPVLSHTQTTGMWDPTQARWR